MTITVCARRRRRQKVALGPDFIVEKNFLNHMVAPKMYLLFILLPAYLEMMIALRSNTLIFNNLKHYPPQTKPCGGYEVGGSLDRKMPHRELMIQ